MENIKIEGIVEKFNLKAAWYYIKVPKNISNDLFGEKYKGLIPITITLNNSKWDSSLLPFGDGTYFIAIKAKIRKDEKIELNDRISLNFSIRGL
jgi:hypothetical protein